MSAANVVCRSTMRFVDPLAPSTPVHVTALPIRMAAADGRDRGLRWHDPTKRGAAAGRALIEIKIVKL